MTKHIPVSWTTWILLQNEWETGIGIRRGVFEAGCHPAYTEGASNHSPPPLRMAMPEDIVKPDGCDLQTPGKAEISKGDRQLNPFINLIQSNYKVLNAGRVGNGMKLECNLICKMN